MFTITLHYDFTDRTELSYVEAKKAILEKTSFTTNCLDFFNLDIDCAEIIVLKKDGSKIKRTSLLSSNDNTDKEIRSGHNIQKMLKAESLKFIKDEK